MSSEKDRPRIAVVGAGYWGKNLVRNLYSLNCLEAICDLDTRLERSLESRYPGINFTASYSELLSDGSIDAIVIATPAVSHFRLAREALLAGKDVFVEKPLALRIQEGRHLVTLASERSKIIMVGHILQYHPAVEHLKRLIDQGELGKIQYIYSNRLNIGRIRAEENILWSFAPHDISVILMLLGELPESVNATGGSYLQYQVSDVTVTTMDFASGVKGHIFVSWLHPYKEQKLVVVGDKKMAVFDDLSKEKLFLYPHQIQWLNRVPVVSRAEHEVVQIKVSEPLKKECEHFIECIRTRRRPKTDGEEGLRVLQVLEACQDSLNAGGSRIKLQREALAAEDGDTSTGFYIHESSYLDKDVEIGKGTRIWHYCHILSGSRIGSDCSIGQNVMIGPRVHIGHRCKIQNNVSVYEGVCLEDEVFCGPGMVFTNVYNPRSAIPRMHEKRPTLVKQGATIGANATVICGITIGRYAFIAAGAVVLEDVPDYALVAGNPATRKGWMCECGIRLRFNKDKARCKACGRSYGKETDRVIPLDEDSTSTPL